MIKPLPTRIVKVLRLSCGKPVGRLLDIGCGSGEFSVLLKKAFKAKELFGVELSPEGQALATEKGIQVSRLDLNKEPLPYPDNFFGMVFAGEILEHLIIPDDLLDEIFRVLAPGGHLILTLPNISSWHCRVQLLLGYQPYAIPVSMRYRWVGAFLATQRYKGARVKEHAYVNSYDGLDHVQFFANRGACDLVKVHEFNIVEVIGTSTDEFTIVLPPVARTIVKWIDGICTHIPSLASGVIIHATKP